MHFTVTEEWSERSRGLAASCGGASGCDPPHFQDLQDLQGWMCRTGRPEKVIWDAKTRHLEGLGLHFDTPGHRLAEPGVTGATQQDTLGSRHGFLSIWGGFWDPPGTPFEVTGVTFR